METSVGAGVEGGGGRKRADALMNVNATAVSRSKKMYSYRVHATRDKAGTLVCCELGKNGKLG